MRTAKAIIIGFAITGFVLGFIWVAVKQAKKVDKPVPVLTDNRTENEILQASLAVQAAAMDSMENVFINSLDEIDRNMNEIARKAGIITIGTNAGAEVSASTKDKILKSLSMINSLMEENREKVDRLTEELKNSKINNAALEKLTKRASELINEYDEQIVSLKELLVSKSYEKSELDEKLTAVELKAQKFEDLVGRFDKEANTAYYTMGYFKDLKRDGIVDKTGSVLGIGGTTTLKKDFDPELFNKVDIRELTVIPLDVKSAELVTNHPSDSYEFIIEKNKVTSLEITDPDKFWRNSRYMVLAIK